MTHPKQLNDIDKMIINIVMLSMGIVPIEKATLDMNVCLNQLSLDEARTMKRKFRKLWKKAIKSKNTHFARDWASAECGNGKHVPSRNNCNARKHIVFEYVYKKFVDPMIQSYLSRKEITNEL